MRRPRDSRGRPFSLTPRNQRPSIRVTRRGGALNYDLQIAVTRTTQHAEGGPRAPRPKGQARTGYAVTDGMAARWTQSGNTKTCKFLLASSSAVNVTGTHRPLAIYSGFAQNWQTHETNTTSRARSLNEWIYSKNQGEEDTLLAMYAFADEAHNVGRT